MLLLEAFLSPSRLVRLQQQYATSARALAEASDKQSDSVNLSANYSWNQYEGEGLDGIVHGHGQSTGDDGRIYVGESIEGKRTGQGKITYPNGMTHEGEFKCDRLWNGTGVLRQRNGTVYEGTIEEGEMMMARAKLPKLMVIPW